MNRALLGSLGSLAAMISLCAEVLPVEDWKKWSPRPEISPQFTSASDLGIRTKQASDYGAWQQTVKGIKGGKPYLFEARYKVENVSNEDRSVIPRLEWLDEKSNMLRPPEYAVGQAETNGWRAVSITTTAPEKSSALKVQLGFGFAPNAKIEWAGVSLDEAADLSPRTVKVATIFHRPRGSQSAAESVEQFCEMAKRTAAEKPDVICLPEGISVVGTSKSYWEVSEPVPGPTTERLGSLARELHSYLVAGLYEREGDILYNTAVLIARDGKLTGKYRKTHLPREEWEAGITPGDEYPVFQTDFGKVGLIICWDVQFPEPARAMARKGAEILLLPIWGGNEVLAKARAIENHVFLVSSSYDMKTFIVDPVGFVLAEATAQNPVVVAELPLDKKYYQPWLGDMKHRTWKERRPDIAIDPH